MSYIKNLVSEFDGFTLAVPYLEIADHGVTVLQGESGSGKTTLLQTLIGLSVPQQSWEWNFKGENLSQMPVGDRRLGVVFQNYDLFPHLSAEENISLVMKARHSHSSLPELLKKIEQYKNQLNLNKCWQTQAQKLSGGEKQRVALLRAVVSNPRMLLLDEPFSALDEKLRIESRETLKNFIQQFDIPVLLVTHDKEDVEVLAQYRIYMQNGSILQSNS